MINDEDAIEPSGDPGGTVDEGNGLYRLLVESVRDYGIFLLDTEGHVASWNEGAQRIKGYSAEDIIGRHFSTFYPEEDKLAEKPKMELEGATRDGRFEDEGWRIRKDGTQFWANVVITALRTGNGELVGFAKVTRDLTERRAAEQKAIEDAKRVTKAELANRTKSEFLAAMSHELRTPLNAIAGYADLLEMGIAGMVNPQQRDYIGRIRNSQQHLLGIINDLLNFSRIEAGQVTYNQSPVSLGQVVDAVVPLLEPQAAAKGIRVERLRCAEEIIGIADRPRVEQIVLNLMSNAVKFTGKDGHIGIGCGSSGETVFITVSDTGAGIAEDQQEAIFEPFVQVGRTLSSANEGTGLGLAISRDLARAMGGDVTVESVEGSGSTFTLMLPSA